jgi:uncharacterized alpha-E superfamily protein
MESMTRGLGWQFLDIGRRLERGIQLTALLRAGLLEEATPDDLRRLENVLEGADSSMTYRSRYQTTLQLPLVLDLLLKDEANPHSVAFQLVRLAKRFSGLPRVPQAQAEEILERIRRADIDELIGLEPQEDGAPRRSALAELLSDLQAAFPDLGDVLTHAYLVHAIARRQSPDGPREGS